MTYYTLSSYMVDQPTQPTILVKKPDGTEVRMTMAEVMKMKRQQSSASSTPAPSPAPAAPAKKQKKAVPETPKPAPPKNLPTGDTVQLDIKPSGNKKKRGGREKSKRKPLVLPIRHKESPAQKQPIRPPQPQVRESKPGAQTDLRVSQVNLPAVPPPHALSTTTPVKDIFVDEAIANSQAATSVQVPLSPPPPPPPPPQPPTPQQPVLAPAPPQPGPLQPARPPQKRKKKKGWSIVRKKKSPKKRRVAARPRPLQSVAPAVPPASVVSTATPVSAVPQQVDPVYPAPDTKPEVSAAQPQTPVQPTAPTPAPSLEVQRGTQQKAADVLATSSTTLSPSSPSAQPVGGQAKDGWAAEDHGSLLEETLESHEAGDATHIVPPSYGSALSGVLKKIDFDVPSDLHGRLQSLVQSRLKDIRTDEQVFLYATKAVDAGGLGLGDAQGATLVSAISGAKIDPAHVVKEPKPVATQTKKKKEITLPTPVQIPDTPVVSAPQKLGAAPVASALPVTPPPVVEPLPAAGIPKVSAPPETIDNTTLKAQSVLPPLPDIDVPPPPPGSKSEGMHDVVTPFSSGPMSPVDEIGTFKLEDFRRLAGDPQQAAGRFLQKFETLKNESHILYVDAIHAWHQSPLYMQYQDVLADALDQKRQIMDVLGEAGKDGIQPEEFSELVHLGEQLKA